MTKIKNNLFPHVSLRTMVVMALWVAFGLFIGGPFVLWIRKPEDASARRRQPEPDEPMGKNGQIPTAERMPAGSVL